ncbi:MAG TPA: anthranilate synthase component I family protein [Chitinophagaceae bacterium]|nr:anthranilate synthase component I family protein [Chitinophagaceae bacterium]
MKAKVLNWAQQFSTFCFLDNHEYELAPHSEECILAAGVRKSIVCPAGQALQELDDFIEKHKGWLFGHLGYDLKNEIESLSSSHPDRVGFPDLYFFVPEVVIRFSNNKMEIDATDPQKIYDEIINKSVSDDMNFPLNGKIYSGMSKEGYIEVIRHLKEHILKGDCYEINFCMEFLSENVQLNPLAIYSKLSHVSPNPFSALYRMNDKWLICASPERFLKKTGSKILSQPMKGTSRRVNTDLQTDIANKEILSQSEKDRAENVMVVDLVRNDLARVCKEGSVHVDELFGVYSFPQVHQMVSTVSGVLEEHVSFGDIIRATFPMGSMTGAPKKSVMELIEKYEKNKRGIFSGAVGYISPNRDFDFNVVIRSIMYNSSSLSLSFQAGSGITFYSDPDIEWEECLLKAEAIKKVLQSEN